MTQVIDLSRIITEGMPVYPGDDPTGLRQSRYLAVDHYNDHRLEISMHAGTHIDGPMHLTESRQYISDLNIDLFTGEGCLLDVREQPVIGVQPEYAELIPENSIVLLYTGFDRNYGQALYYENHPIVNDELGQLLAAKKIKLLGVDMPSPDQFPFPVHQRLMAAGICLIENLTNLDRIPRRDHFEVIALPLNIRANGSPARVIARV